MGEWKAQKPEGWEAGKPGLIFDLTKCLENGIIGQGDSKEGAITKVKEAIDSVEEMRKSESDIYTAPVSIRDLHEFLTVESPEPLSEPMEMRALYA